MNTIENYQFITGTYNIEQANDMLKALYKSLINYHKIENLSTQVRYDTLNNEALEAIEKLKQEMQDIDQTINVARLIDKKIKIKSTIEVYYE
jgi:radical SAM superfamily enzyme